MAKLALKGGRPVREEPFPAWPVWDDREVEAAEAVIRSGRWGMAQGDRVSTLEQRFASYQDAAHGIASTSGTTALRTALLASGLEAGAEVIVPAYTFVASATVVLECNMVPIFADIEPDTYNLDPDSMEKVATGNTRAVMPVHLAGLPADMDRIGEVARSMGLVVIEDACQAWGSEHRGRKVGALGLCGAFSFQSSKHITAGEGGMLITNDSECARISRSLVNCGRVEGGAWHEHALLGGNYRLSELQAGVLLAQLDRYGELLERRQKSAAYLREKLGAIDGIRPLEVPDYVTAASCHMLILRFDSEAFGGLARKTLVAALNAEGVKPAHGGYYTPVYRQKFLREKQVGPYDRIRTHPYQGKVIDYSDFHCPVAERACAGEAVWILQNLLLAEQDDLEDIVRAFEKIRENYLELL